ncbi:twin-arginine translocase subunit TatC [Acidocella aminolytica]|uniref:Sec-independent protein translocase protein TatC n=1 Tax=Acidocella aminolytica 101 = DSM 11237 TaxID=1120923 RepID=A0A0D6PC11_9PROT|nr:twin-arginine translocase subunit TatC [Acidocella aminolytica]GAN78901.1 Sec-independent protein translocase TatC [Acidocella aminolytica 101 = DSM 11237]GBQ42264.1 Sec-independent protein translocase TatC [Acidocella aminolytica 101 = DSM 11237]SHE98849.1 Sec-independent protein translocase TatC [Acidocella aminolytica 101 = DSM 11237]
MAADDNEINDKEMPLLEHLSELRRRLIWSAAAFLIAFLVCYHFAQQIYEFLAAPLAHALEARGERPELIYTALYEAFFTYVKVAVFGAAFISFPVVAAQIWLFVAPGLYKREKRALMPFLVVTPILFFAGGALAYYVFFPVAWKFFLSFQENSGGVDISLMAKVSDYLNIVMKLIFAFGLSFELPVLLTLLGKVGIVNHAALKKYRRYAYVGCFVLAAVMAPPDVPSQCIMAGLLIFLFEVSLFFVRMVEPKYEEEAEETAESETEQEKDPENA